MVGSKSGRLSRKVLWPRGRHCLIQAGIGSRPPQPNSCTSGSICVQSSLCHSNECFQKRLRLQTWPRSSRISPLSPQCDQWRPPTAQELLMLCPACRLAQLNSRCRLRAIAAVAVGRSLTQARIRERIARRLDSTSVTSA